MGSIAKKAGAGARTARIGLRATPEQEILIRRAAEAEGKSVTEFVISSSCMAAKNALLDQRLFFADEKSRRAFERALEKPAMIKPHLKNLMAQRSPWEK